MGGDGLLWPASSRSWHCAWMALAMLEISSALGCSNRDISRVKNVIEADGITRDVFNELAPGWFSDRFADGRSKRRMVYDQPDFKALARVRSF